MPAARDQRGDPRVKPEGGLLYKYKAKFGGMDVSDTRRLRALEDGNAKLKKLLAEQMLE